MLRARVGCSQGLIKSPERERLMNREALPDLSRFCRTVPAELPSLPLAQKRKLPQIPAVYLAIGEHNEVLYIGQSVSLSARWSAHHRFPKLQMLGNVRLAWIEFETEEFLEEVERVLIAHFSPKLNGFRDMSDPDRRKRAGIGIFVRLEQAEHKAIQLA